jgi:predicted permease
MQAEERFYEAGRWMWWDHFRQDLRYGMRMLMKSPGFTAIAVLTIALGVGAITAIFSLVNATLLRALPYPNSEELVSVVDDLPGVGAQDVGISVPEWHDFERSGIFQYISPLGFGSVNLTGSSHPARAMFSAVPPNYFAMLGVKPQLGRIFPADDHTPGFTLEVIISDGLWKRAFASDPAILGKSLRLDNDLYQVVGVLPPGYVNPGRTLEESSPEVWAATGFAAPPAPPPLRKLRFLTPTIARLRPGLTIAVAQSQMDALVASLQKQFPDEYPAQSGWRVRLVPLKETVVGNTRQSLILLLGAVCMVLLIGCVNVANLLLARAGRRGREMAVRQSLGAGRRRLVAQLLTESLLLALAGGIAGLLVLFGTRSFLLRMVPESLPRLNEVGISWAVLLFAMGASLVSGAIFGLAPALSASRLDLTSVLKREGRGATRSGEQARTRRWLVITELALSLVLMICAGLLLRSFGDLLKVRLGFNPEKVMAVRMWLPIPNDPETDIYRTAAQEAPLVREIVRRSKTLPGVEEAALGDLAAVPLAHGPNDLNAIPLLFEGRENSGAQPPLGYAVIVSPEYFRLLGIPLRQGRLFNEFDNDKTPNVTVVNETFARTYWPNENPVGKAVKIPASGDRASLALTTVIGVIADAHTESLAEVSKPELFLSLYQRRSKDLAIFVRGQLNTADIQDQLREQVQSVNPELPVFGVQTLSEMVTDSLSERRFSLEMVGLFALTALLLAGLGVYGVISYIVSERTHEIGIRLALGAQSESVMKMILRQGLRLALVGAAIGLVCSAIVSRFLAGLLYGVRPTDPLTFLGVAILLVLVAVLATVVPARRALRVDPMTALRHE